MYLFIYKIIRQSFSFFITLFVIFLTSRIFEQIYLSTSHGIADGQIKMGIAGLAQDLSISAIVTILLLPLTALLQFFSKRIVSILYISLSVIISLTYSSLVIFFQHALKPLDGVIFEMSIGDMVETLNNTASIPLIINVYVILHALAGGILCYILLKKWNEKIKPKKIILFGIVILTSASAFFVINKTVLAHKDYLHYLQNNKLLYPLSSLLPDPFKEYKSYNQKEYKRHISYYQNLIKRREFIDPEYPFLSKIDKSNPIGDFFTQSTQKPNIVLIIVESLGTMNSFPNPYHGVSFTPFLDSLAQNGLYWSNFYANHERTFGVLPTLLGSMPSSEKGFNDLGRFIPNHISLPRLLGKNLYYTSFFYGGWLGFDKMERYLNRQNFHWIESESTASTEGDDDEVEQEFNWGDNDMILYERALPYIKEYEASKPRLDIFLTLSTHEPYKIPDEELWETKFVDLLNKQNLSESQQDELKHKSSHLQSIMFADSAISFLFHEVKKMDRFKNTIFIITGDHSLPFFTNDYIERYHVPLIIFSPLLNSSKTFDAFGSHLDITPTIAALLAENYGVKIPEATSWLGFPLDTSMLDNPYRFVPIMQTNRVCEEFIFNNQFHTTSQRFNLIPNTSNNPENIPLIYNNLNLLKGYLAASYKSSIYNKLTTPDIFFNYSNIVNTSSITDETLIKNSNLYHTSDSGNYHPRLSKEQYFLIDGKFFNIFDTLVDCQKNTVTVKGTYQCFYKSKSASDMPSLVLSVDDLDGNSINWLRYDIKSRFTSLKRNEWNQCEAAFLVKLPNKIPEKAIVKLYFYNPRIKSIAIKDVNFEVVLENQFDTL